MPIPRVLAPILAILVAALAPTTASAQQERVVKAAADLSFPPFAYRTPGGKPEGFVVDLMAAVAKEMGVQHVVVAQEWSGIFAGLFAEHFDVIIAPVTVTAERAERMAFTEGYLETSLAMLTLKGDAIPDFASLKGKAVGVNNGSISDTWATKNAEQYGFTVQRYLKVPDAVQAVQTRRVYTALAELGSMAHIAKQQTGLSVAKVIDLGGVFAFAIKPERIALRNEIDRAIECVKKKGTLATLYRKWFDTEPSNTSPVLKPIAGYGVPDMKYYDPTSHEITCR